MEEWSPGGFDRGWDPLTTSHEFRFERDDVVVLVNIRAGDFLVEQYGEAGGLVGFNPAE